ncbi:MAG: hypothetical protein JG764_1903 [Clostridiales bacterium]|jgi:hypothetical protein|nr:hypothetical protein [Clostridiales bacterium]
MKMNNNDLDFFRGLFNACILSIPLWGVILYLSYMLLR